MMFPNKYKIAVLLSISILLSGCGSSSNSDDANTNIIEQATPQSPTVILTASTDSTPVNTEFTLTWTSENTNTCAASGDWETQVNTSGSETLSVGQAGAREYLISCEGDGGQVSDSVIIEITETDQSEIEGDSVNTVFIGHSFFIPIAREIPSHLSRLGIEGVNPFVEFSGGASGAPLALWNDDEHRSNIQAVLDTGEVELFAMTYEPTFPTTDGYILWIDYALAQNPQTKIVLGLPWIDFPNNYENTAEYAQRYISLHDSDWVNLVETLRVMYPQVEILSVPYGAGVVRLRTLFDAGELSGITDLGSRDPATSIFRDEKGHGHQDGILLELTELIWLASIFDVDLTNYEYDAGFDVDLKAIATDISDTYNSGTLCCISP